MKRIALIVASFPKLSETFIVNKFLGLVKQGWDVHVVCGESDNQEWQRFPEIQSFPGVHRRVHVVWPHRPRWLAALLTPAAFMYTIRHNPGGSWRYLYRGWRKFRWDLLRRFYLDSTMLEWKPDLIHMEFGPLAAERMYLRELLGCGVVVSFRGYDLNFVGLDNPEYYREVWNQADALHLLGEDLWQRAQKRGCPSEKMHRLIPPALDPTKFDGEARQPAEVVGTAGRPLRIASVGRLEWKKGYEYALQAVRRLLDQGISCEYRIVGNGSYLGAIGFARHQLGLESVVRFMGALSQPEVLSQLLWADVFLHAAVTEGFCNATLEAQAMGLPVVCTDAGGLPENVAHGETGFVAPRRNPSALAEKLALLAKEPRRRQEMGQAGRQRVLTHFQITDQILAFDRLYSMVLDKIDREQKGL
jgi:colanic acid/amylovoran biosynthesis glycosyltransferase